MWHLFPFSRRYKRISPFESTFVWNLMSSIVPAMAGRVQLFCSAQEFYRDMGIYSRRSNEKWPFTLKSLFFLFGFLLMCVGSTAYSSVEAESVFEHGACFFAVTTTIGSIAYFITQLCQITNILNLVANCENFIEKSKCRRQPTAY